MRGLRVPSYATVPSSLKTRVVGTFVNQGRGTQIGSVRRYLGIHLRGRTKGVEHSPRKKTCADRRLCPSLSL